MIIASCIYGDNFLHVYIHMNSMKVFNIWCGGIKAKFGDYVEHLNELIWFPGLCVKLVSFIKC